MGRSKAQDNLMRALENIYPLATLTDEVYIGDLIETNGYTIKEIQRELGHKPHKMFVDILMSDSEQTVAFEYNGRQHYETIGNMTRTTADVLVNQQLDREKSWILARIGVPLVIIPYDTYLDDTVIARMIDDAAEECSRMRNKLTECSKCGRLFPPSALSNGICNACRTEAEAQNGSVSNAKTSYEKHYNNDESTKRADMKEKMKRRRRKAYDAYKNSDEYRRQREIAKQKRKEAYRAYKDAKRHKNAGN